MTSALYATRTLLILLITTAVSADPIDDIREAVSSLRSVFHDAYGTADADGVSGASYASSQPPRVFGATAGQHPRNRRQGPVNPFGMPRTLYCLFNVAELNKVDGVEQSFYVDARFTCYYQEPSLAGTVPAGFMAPMPDNITAHLRQNVAWLDLDWLNQRQSDVVNGLRTFLMMSVPGPFDAFGGVPPLPHWDLATTPWIAMTMRVSGLFKAELELKDFPFDSQTVWVNVTAFAPPSQMQFADLSWLPGASMTGEIQDVIGWEVQSEVATNSTRFFPEYGMPLPFMSLAIKVKRVPNYYINKIVIGVMFVTLMSQLTFLIDPRDTNRPVAAMTAFLGIVTYLFVISNDVPKVAYLTRMDSFVNLSFYFVFMNFFVHVVFYALVRVADRAEQRAEDLEKEHEEQYNVPPTAGEPVSEDEAGHSGTVTTSRDDSNAKNGKHTQHHNQRSAVEKKKGWWHTVKSLLRTLDYLILMIAIIGYLIAVIAILTGASS